MKRFLVPLLLLAAVPCWAGTRDLKEDTAAVIVVGPFVDDTGAAVTAPTIASIDITAYKNDGTAVGITPAASGSSNDMVHVDDGYYSLEVTTTDTSTPGYLRLTFQISGSLIFHEDFNILPANIYDSKYSTDKLQVDMTQIEGADATDTLLTAANIQSECEDAIAVYFGTTTRSELTAVPSDTPTILQMIQELYCTMNYKSTQTATEYVQYRADGTTVRYERTTSDDGTVFTKGESRTAN